VIGMHRSAAAWAHAGMDVAIDHVLLDRPTVDDLRTALVGLEVLHVGLICDPDVLEDREREVHGAGPGRGLGTAVAQLEITRDIAARDLILDTTEATTGELVDRILLAVERRS
jgi:chloramphenicol 3-O-phosphotransferase